MKFRKVVTGAILVLIFYLIVSLSRNIWQLYSSGKQVETAELQVKKLAKERYELQQEVNQMEKPEVEEKIIRDTMNMVKPGETLVMLPQEIEEEKVDLDKFKDQDEFKPNWQLWWEKFR